MSPEDIFAAQMWPWPEPALKRDAMGRVLFVNAAFLQMYGGQIDDWRGNLVTGWPAPQPPGMPYRFETRLPSEQGEQIYDWMEFTMADGNAFAMARNVTYLFQAPEPDPGVTEQDPEMSQAQNIAAQAAVATGANAMPVMAEQYEQAPVMQTEEPAQDFVQPPVYEQIQEQVQQQIQEPVLQAASVQNYVAESQEAAMDIHQEVSADPVFDSASYTDLTESVPAAENAAPEIADYAEPVIETPPLQPAVTEERAYERRALPIENEDAVLGNNWRDAVIAKAVGAGAVAESKAQTADAKAPNTGEAQAEGGAIRILLAEDNAINALLTRTLLEAEGHTVETVEDGVLACEAMKSSKYDLIFMDMRMPNMDGLEATRKIRSMSNVSDNLPIIALTANAFDDDRNACFDSGMNDFMTKPVSAEELSEMVRTWTKSKAEREAA